MFDAWNQSSSPLLQALYGRMQPQGMGSGAQMFRQGQGQLMNGPPGFPPPGGMPVAPRGGQNPMLPDLPGPGGGGMPLVGGGGGPFTPRTGGPMPREPRVPMKPPGMGGGIPGIDGPPMPFLGPGGGRPQTGGPLPLYNGGGDMNGMPGTVRPPMGGPPVNFAGAGSRKEILPPMGAPRMFDGAMRGGAAQGPQMSLGPTGGYTPPSRRFGY